MGFIFTYFIVTCNSEPDHVKNPNDAEKVLAKAALEKALNADRNHNDYLKSLQRAFDAASKAGVAAGDSTYRKVEEILAKVSQVTNC